MKIMYNRKESEAFMEKEFKVKMNTATAIFSHCLCYICSYHTFHTECDYNCDNYYFLELFAMLSF